MTNPKASARRMMTQNRRLKYNVITLQISTVSSQWLLRFEKFIKLCSKTLTLKSDTHEDTNANSDVRLIKIAPRSFVQAN